jgi:hypothetical protein
VPEISATPESDIYRLFTLFGQLSGVNAASWSKAHKTRERTFFRRYMERNKSKHFKHCRPFFPGALATSLQACPIRQGEGPSMTLPHCFGRRFLCLPRCSYSQLDLSHRSRRLHSPNTP